MTPNWSEAFSRRTSEIREHARAMLANSTLLNSFRAHKPAWGYFEIVAAARDLRSAADELDKLAKKMKGRATDYTEAA